MKTTVLQEIALDSADDCVVLGCDGDGFRGAIGREADQWLGGALTRCIDKGLLGRGTADAHLVPLAGDDHPASLLVVGLDQTEPMTQEHAYCYGGKALRRLVERPFGRIVLVLPELVGEEFQANFIAGAIAACEGQDLYRETRTTRTPNELVLAGADPQQAALGITLGNAINLTRRFVNGPPNLVYPESFVSEVTPLAEQAGLEVEVWDEKRLAKENCRAMLAVGAASERPPRLLILRHRGGRSEDRSLALVGKGVTFDSGGLSLKPSESMTDMKCDMAGAATVVGAMMAIAQQELPVNVVGYCGLVENMISGRAYKLGDVITARSGKTIEILNTDAEGRVVLADVLDVVCDDDPQGIVDLATLTGACMVALGQNVCGLFANEEELAGQVRSAAEQAGERVWQLPMFAEYGEQIKSQVADIKNVGAGRWGGAITAAKFLEAFVRETPWVHLDIAGPAFADSSKPFRDAGATGVMVRTLVQLANSWQSPTDG